MPKGKPSKKPVVGSKKKVAAAPAIARKGAPKAGKAEKKVNPLFEKRPKNFSIGQDIQPKRDLTRFVKWPKYIQLQRKRRILLTRLKVPPTINQFQLVADKQSDAQVMRLLKKYRPESAAVKKDRLKAVADARAAGKDAPNKQRPPTIKSGIQLVTRLVEKKKAKLVVIAHDVEPIEIVMFLPLLCKKMGVPYCIVKSKARLGRIVRRKTCAVVAVTDTKSEDRATLSKVAESCKNNFNDRFEEIRRTWGGGINSQKSRTRINKLERQRAREEAKRAKA